MVTHPHDVTHADSPEIRSMALRGSFLLGEIERLDVLTALVVVHGFSESAGRV
jgi:hypothetical protein